MIGSRGRLAVLAAVLAVSVAGLLPVMAQDEFDFMPKGGKTLLIEFLGPQADPGRVGAIAGASRSEDEWAALLRGEVPALSDQEVATLAAYLVINTPFAEGALAGPAESLFATLPRDGRQLAWEECQFCHSLFSSQLTQDREVQGWRNMFESPFHREINLTPQEREEFSRYSAINMPMKIDDVPQALRF